MEPKELFKEYLQMKGLSPLSIYTYLLYYKRFGPLEGFNQDRVNSFALECNNQSPVRAFINNLRSFLLINSHKFNLDEVIIRKVELAKRTGAKERRLPVFIREEEVLRIERGFDSERNKLMVLYNFYLGARVSELINIGVIDFQVDWNDIDRKIKQNIALSNVPIKIRGKRSKERIEYVPPHILHRTHKWLLKVGLKGKPEDNKPIFRIGVRRWQVLLKKASVKTLGKNLTPHCLRHSCATWLYNIHKWDLKEIADYLGHDSIKTTEIYTHLDNSKLREKTDGLFQGLTPGNVPVMAQFPNSSV